MPGRTPQEAVQAFLDPLASALSCVVHGKIVPTPGGRTDPSRAHVWVLNGAEGAPLGKDFVLKAGMQYRIVQDETDGMGPWRVTTDGYMYSVDNSLGQEMFSWHWHPASSGPHKDPHAHFPSGVISMDGSFLARTPMPTGRTTFESFIRYVIQSFELTPLCQDWDARLALAEGPHKLHRTWHNSPEEKQI